MGHVSVILHSPGRLLTQTKWAAINILDQDKWTLEHVLLEVPIQILVLLQPGSSLNTESGSWGLSRWSTMIYLP